MSPTWTPARHRELVAYLERPGVSPAEVAKAVNASLFTVMGWKVGESDPSPDQQEALEGLLQGGVTATTELRVVRGGRDTPPKRSRSKDAPLAFSPATQRALERIDQGALDAEFQDLAQGIVKRMATTKKKATKKTAAKKKATKKPVAKKKATKKTAAKKKATKKTAAKKTAAKKKATKKGRSKARGAQGKRLGAWKLVSKDDLFAHLAKTNTKITGLAKAIGVSPSVVYAWKAGRRFPSEEAQRKLADVVSGQTPVARTSSKQRGGSAKGGKVSVKKLRAAREARGLSRAALAKQLGVSAGAVQNWESGKSSPTGANKAKVRAFLNEGTPKAVAPLPALPGATQAPLAATGGEAATVGAAQVASAYLAAGHPLRPEDVVAFVRDLRHALS